MPLTSALVSRTQSQKGEGHIHSDKWHRCVEHVSAQGGDYEPHAVCTASVGYSGSINKEHRTPGKHASTKHRKKLDAAQILKFEEAQHPRDKQGEFTFGKGTLSTGTEHVSTPASREVDRAAYTQLRNRWSKINTRLLDEVHDPESPEAKAMMGEMKDIVKDMYRLDADPGGIEGIGLPGPPRDIVIIGGGPGGMAAGIHAGAEGLDTLLLEASDTAGGQSKHSSRVENVPGFPVGISGAQLASNTFEEVQRMGADTKLKSRVTGITNDPVTGIKTISLESGEKITTRAVVIAGGVEIKKYGEPGGPPKFPGSDCKSIIYGDGGKVISEAAGQPVTIIGGSNGASQAALAAAKSSHVTLIARSALSKGMSVYQEGQIRNHKNITVVEGDEVTSVATDKNGKAVSVTTKKGTTIKAAAIGVFVGSMPSTAWLPPEIKKTKENRIDADINMETSIPGIFAIGDIRGGVLPGKPRIGVAMGEGAMVVPNVFDYFKKQTPMKLAVR